MAKKLVIHAYKRYWGGMEAYAVYQVCLIYIKIAAKCSDTVCLMLVVLVPGVLNGIQYLGI